LRAVSVGDFLERFQRIDHCSKYPSKPCVVESYIIAVETSNFFPLSKVMVNVNLFLRLNKHPFIKTKWGVGA